MEEHIPDRARSQGFMQERRRARFIFNLTAAMYPLIERHLFPRYEGALARLDLPAELTVLDVATGSGILAAAFARRGHPTAGLDFSERLLKRARKRFPEIDFRTFDLVDLPDIPSKSYGIVSSGYLLHGLSVGFREAILKNISRIAGRYVVVFDYCCAGGWLVRLIEQIEGPNYLQFIATPREVEFAGAGLRIEQSFRISSFGDAWLCRPE
ncbi:MAG TPA: class I SAM-dependent methyltransferase [Patescibacteria group bacterium]|nr:class I SAM-dependent methyltransferase [Patescibacteria group bacterium]